MNSPLQMDEYCKEQGFVAWYETSAKENINIDEAARHLVSVVRIIRLDVIELAANTCHKMMFRSQTKSADILITLDFLLFMFTNCISYHLSNICNNSNCVIHTLCGLTQHIIL